MIANDIVIILVMTFPMYLFSIFPGIKASEYLGVKYGLSERRRRTILVGATFLFALSLSSLLYYV